MKNLFFEMVLFSISTKLKMTLDQTKNLMEKIDSRVKSTSFKKTEFSEMVYDCWRFYDKSKKELGYD